VGRTDVRISRALGVILLLNGAFGIGKTTVARVLVRRLPCAVLLDPELLGIALQRVTRVGGLSGFARLRRHPPLRAGRAARLPRGAG
jgi:hypothetical protein